MDTRVTLDDVTALIAQRHRRREARGELHLDAGCALGAVRPDPADRSGRPGRGGSRPLHPEQGTRARSRCTRSSRRRGSSRWRGSTRSCSHGGHLGSHPDRTQVPGVEASTGSLGHGLPIAAGVALGAAGEGPGRTARLRPVRRRRAERGLELGGDPPGAALRLGNLTLLVVDNHSSEPDMSHWRERLGGVRLGRARRRRPRSRRAGGRLSVSRHDERPTAVVADVPAGEW